MSTTTTNLGLVKPAGTEAADIAVINSNMDTIDTAVAAKQDAAVTDIPGITYGIAAGGANSFKKVGNMVFITFQSAAVALSSGQTVFTLPSGYRPADTVIAPAVFSGQAFGAVTINTSGVCSIAQISSSVTARVLINLAFSLV